VTYFCDGAELPESATYRRFNPPTAAGAEPCLASAASVNAARAAARDGTADFIMINLPNADIHGHVSDVATTVRAIHCMEALLESFVRDAQANGFSVFITSDHGNAEGMDPAARGGGLHTTNPVPFIALAPTGQPAYRLASRPDATLVAVAPTLLDALGLLRSEQSLLVR
jgi:2,3-bisphosphoglycerate-independent phosphoglycerate mutase